MTSIDTTNAFSSLSGQQGGIAEQSSFEEDYNQFLQLLTVQLQHQDPTAPMDTNQFTEQLVMFSQVEQQMASNAHLEQLVALESGNQLAAATSFVGEVVEVPGVSAEVEEEGSGATWRYELPSSAAQTEITIRDASGSTVYRTQGETQVGQHEFEWDGIDRNGDPVPAGSYSIQVLADTASGEPLVADVTHLARVDGLESEDGFLTLDINGRQVAFEDVRSLHASN